MALDINGYSNVFKTFVDFAQQRVDANDENAIADAHVQKPLVGRKTLAITQSLTDEVHKWTRGMDEWTVNDRTRALFKKAIADMFGGESKIPASVKKAMVLSDYGAGNPAKGGGIRMVLFNIGKILANPDNLNERGLEDINYLLSEIRKDIGDKSGRSENRLGNEIMIEAEDLP